MKKKSVFLLAALLSTSTSLFASAATDNPIHFDKTNENIGLGDNITTNEKINIAIGKNITTNGSTIAIGKGSNFAGKNLDGVEDIVIVSLGYTAKNANQSVLVGNNTTTKAKNSIAIGFGATIADKATGAIAIGHKAYALDKNSVALGFGSTTYEPDLPVYGESSKVPENQRKDRSHGYDPIASFAYTNGPAYYADSHKEEHRYRRTDADAGVISVGNVKSTNGGSNEYTFHEPVRRRIINLSAGINPTDAVNVGQLNDVVTLIRNTSPTLYVGGKIENNTYHPGKALEKDGAQPFFIDFSDDFVVTKQETSKTDFANRTIKTPYYHIALKSPAAPTEPAAPVETVDATVNTETPATPAITKNEDGSVTIGEATLPTMDVINQKETTNKNEMQGQIQDLETRMDNRVNRRLDSLSDDIKHTGSLMAALNGLKVAPFTEDHRAQIMAGVGHYKGSTSIATGVAYMPNNDIMLHGSLAFGHQQSTAFSGGVSFKVGPASKKGTTSDTIRVNRLEARVAELDNKNRELEQRNQDLERKINELYQLLKK